MQTTFSFFFIICLTLLAPFSGRSQFQRNYGTALDDSYSKVIQDGSDFYVLGQTEPSQGALSRATVTRLDADGLLQWTLSLDIASVWFDAVLTPNGDLLVVGATLPFDATTKSLLGVVTNTGGGSFSCLRSYDEPGRDFFYRIVKNPAPENPDFPYYILGSQNQAGATTTTEDVVLANVDASCNFNWKKVYTSAFDDEFFRDLEVLPGGELLFAGNNENLGFIFKTDNAGNMINGVQIPQLSFVDIGIKSTGGIIAAANSMPAGNAHMLYFDADLILQSDHIISELNSIKQVWEGMAGKDVATGRGTFDGAIRDIVIKILDNGPVVEWAKYFNAGNAAAGGSAWAVGNMQIAYTDSRVLPDPFGGTCAFMSQSDLDLLNACLVAETSVSLQIVEPLPDGPVLPPIGFWDVPMGTNLTFSSIDWLEAEVCNNDPCAIDLDVTLLNNCGHVQVNSITTGPGPYTYQWCSGETSANIDVILPCGEHTFCATVTCADGSTATVSETIVISDNIPPTASCQLPFGVELDANCQYHITPAMIDDGSTDNCQIQSMSVNPEVLNGCGVFPITLTVEDWCGNISTCTTEIQTIEVVPPVMTCPLDLTLHCDDDLDPATTGFAIATDNCDPNPVITYSDVISGQMPCDGLLQRTWTATDNCGNESTCVQNILVFDNEAPMITCPADMTVTSSSAPPCEMIVNGIQWLSATDNCGTPVVTHQVSGATAFSGSGDASGQPFNQGVSTLTYTATDECGNPAVCTFQVTVECAGCCDESHNIIVNGSFSGLPSGNLLTGSVPWYAADLSPQISTADGCDAPGAAQMWGNSFVGEVVGQTSSPAMFKSGWTYRISFCGKFFNLNNLPPYLAHGWFNLRGGTAQSTVNGPICTSCTTIGQSPVLNQDNVWEQVCLPDWTANADYDRLFINFQNSSFANSGDSTSWGRIDDICIEVIDSITCCGNLEEFCLILENGVDINVSNDSCKVSLHINNLQDCDYIEYIDWGPEVSQGPFGNGDILMYTYPLSGSYDICYLAIELDTAGIICFEKTVCNTVTIECDTCVCAPPDLELTTGNLIIPLSCNEADTSLWPVLPCPAEGVTISGAFGCYHPSTGIPCAETPVNWTMEYADGSVSAGVINNAPILHFHAGLISDPGIYSLTFSTLCPGAMDSCVCKVSWIQELCDTLCPDNIVQNGMFSSGTPPGTDQSIQFATNWGSIWSGGSTGDFYNTSTSPPPFNIPMPVTQGNHGAMWCRYQGSDAVWREGIMNELGTPIQQHSGCYDLSFKLACLYDNPGPSYPGLSVFGVTTTGFGTGTITDGDTPANLGIFPAGTIIELGSYLIPAACDKNYQTITFNFNSSVLPSAGISHIFFTRTDSIPGAEYVAIDDICLHPVACAPDSCCSDLDAFLTAAAAVQANGELGDCMIHFNAMGLDSCMQISYIWGDSPPVVDGPYGNNTPVWHTYPGPGTYQVCYFIEEVNANDSICWTYEHCEDILVLCEDCECGEYTDMFIRTGGAPSQAVTCGGDPIPLACPQPGNSFVLTGLFECAGEECPEEAPLSWTLTDGNNSWSGTTSAYPYFTINLLPNYFPQAGLYTLTITGLCGMNECPCVIPFIVDCPDLCPCDFTEFENDVAKGFANINSGAACKACFAPIALNDCDSVSWHIGSATDPVIGSSYGNSTFCHNFVSSGTYTITMVVFRKRSDGSLCEVFTYSRTINILCVPTGLCTESVFSNPDFDQGAVMGGLNSGGMSDGWMGIWGDPHIEHSATQSSSDDWTILLESDEDSSDVLTSLEPVCLEKGTGTVTLALEFGIKSNGIKSPISIQLLRGDEFSLDTFWNATVCHRVAEIDLSPLDSGEYVDITIPYDLSDWIAEDDCGGDVGVNVRPIIYLECCVGPRTSRVHLDHFCLEGLEVTALTNLGKPADIHLFPNPTTGVFTLQFTGGSPAFCQVEIVDLWGRTLIVNQLPVGNSTHPIVLNRLPEGVYFIKVMENGIPVWAEKIIKL